MRRLEPGLVGMRDAHPGIDALQAVHRCVHFGDENRLVAAAAFLRGAAARNRRLEHRIVVSKVRAGGCARCERKGAGVGGGGVDERVRDAGDIAGHPEAGQAGSEAAAARRGSFPRVEAAFSK